MHFRSSRTASTPRGPDRIESRRPELAGRVLSFFDRLATVPPDELPLRTLLVTDPVAHRRLHDDADLRIFELGWDRELTDARQAVATWLARLFAYDAPGLRGALGPRLAFSAEDHAAIRRGLDDALLAIVLGDRLEPAGSRELLGGWADLVLRR